MRKLWCFGKAEFERTMTEFGWKTDLDVENSEACVISICGKGETHYFITGGGAVLNLDFEDVPDDIIDPETSEVLHRGISETQVDQAVDFMLANLGKDFYIHCSAGVSRSQAFVRVLLDLFPEIYTSESCRPENPCETPNYGVVCKLKRKIYEKENYLG